MAFNYAKEKRSFDAQWLKLEDEYRAAGFDEAGIQAMRKFDWNEFCHRRTFENRNQELPSEVIDDSEDNGCSTLLKKFSSLTDSFDENSFSGRYDWIEAIDNSALAERLKRLNDSEKELLTQFIFYDYTQAEIAAMQGVSQSAVSQRINRIKKF